MPAVPQGKGTIALENVALGFMFVFLFLADHARRGASGRFIGVGADYQVKDYSQNYIAFMLRMAKKPRLKDREQDFAGGGGASSRPRRVRGGSYDAGRPGG